MAVELQSTNGCWPSHRVVQPSGPHVYARRGAVRRVGRQWEMPPCEGCDLANENEGRESPILLGCTNAKLLQAHETQFNHGRPKKPPE